MFGEEGEDSDICPLPATGFSQLAKEFSEIVLSVCSEQLGAPDGYCNHIKAVHM